VHILGRGGYPTFQQKEILLDKLKLYFFDTAIQLEVSKVMKKRESKGILFSPLNIASNTTIVLKTEKSLF
jgi:hypothetical protein